ncbi:peptidylprolyl isomerase [Paenibacillus odorifer]
MYCPRGYCDPWHTVFGRVISGMDHVDTLKRGDES